jgi:hypothetical protein
VHVRHVDVATGSRDDGDCGASGSPLVLACGQARHAETGTNPISGSALALKRQGAACPSSDVSVLFERLKGHPERSRSPKAHELQKIARRKTTNSDEAAAPVNPAPGATPEERLRTAYVELRQRTRAELLDAVRNASPSRFEAVVLDLLHAMGYGRRREDLRQSAAGADGGIDGVISLDRLGLEKV